MLYLYSWHICYVYYWILYNSCTTCDLGPVCIASHLIYQIGLCNSAEISVLACTYRTVVVRACTESLQCTVLFMTVCEFLHAMSYKLQLLHSNQLIMWSGNGSSGILFNNVCYYLNIGVVWLYVCYHFAGDTVIYLGCFQVRYY